MAGKSGMGLLLAGGAALLLLGGKKKKKSKMAKIREDVEKAREQYSEEFDKNRPQTDGGPSNDEGLPQDDWGPYTACNFEVVDDHPSMAMGGKPHMGAMGTIIYTDPDGDEVSEYPSTIIRELILSRMPGRMRFKLNEGTSSAQPKFYHTHYFTITSADLKKLSRGEDVSILTSEPERTRIYNPLADETPHTHSIKIKCEG